MGYGSEEENKSYVWKSVMVTVIIVAIIVALGSFNLWFLYPSGNLGKYNELGWNTDDNKNSCLCVDSSYGIQ